MCNKKFYGRDTVIEIDLDAFEQNINAFCRYLPDGTNVMVTVKANAYGHGAVPIAKACAQAGVSYLGVAFVDEAIALRRARIDLPILVLGYTPPYAIREALQHNLTLTVFTVEQGRSVSDVAKSLGSTANIHVKIDTGMGRIGSSPCDALHLVQELQSLPYLNVEGMYTHLATADSSDISFQQKQERTFQEVISKLEQEEFSIPLIHIANSAGSIRSPKGAYNMVRLGIGAYGYYPFNEVKKSIILQPTLTFKSKVSFVKKPPQGSGISYGSTYTTTGDQWIATVPVGYGDGYSRCFSNRGCVLISGKRVPIVGTICMDQLMVDVTDAMPVSVGDEVVLYGIQGDEEITVDEIARELRTIHYEVTTVLSYRVPRVYLRNGKVDTVYNPLL